MEQLQKLEEINKNDDKITVDKRIRVLVNKEMEIPTSTILNEEGEKDEEMAWINRDYPLEEKLKQNDNSIGTNINSESKNYGEKYFFMRK